MNEMASARMQSSVCGRGDRDNGPLCRQDLSTAITPAARTGRSGLSYIDPDLVERMRNRLRAQTAECVMETFGISVNTWVKMRDGQPIRTSVAERFLQRLSASN
jgi:hypothetical protein